MRFHDGSAAQLQASIGKLKIGSSVGLLALKATITPGCPSVVRMGESSSRQRQVADSMPARYIVAIELLLSSVI